MDLNEFNYHLPPELIAQEPLAGRDDSRLMVLSKQGGGVEHRGFKDLLDYFREGDLLVLNATKVIPARLRGVKEETGGKVEVLLLKKLGNSNWETLVKPGKRVKVGAKIKFGRGELQGEIIEVNKEGKRVIKFESEDNFMDVLKRIGEVPLPPYIRRSAGDKRKLGDKKRYQTIYAREEGAVAAPTAGLHFTEEMLKSIRSQGVRVVFLTLHLGLASFQPLKEGREIKLTPEYYSLPEETCQAIEETRGKIIAVGTSTVRALESVAAQGSVKPRREWTNLFIQPGYRFRVVDALVTNFHLPYSTNLILVAAFAGKEFLLSAYQEAVSNNYRFYSFGDAMLII
ncbi:MAG: tRNA preQ1(34) S-adenosylmethionine ribosyltransferase-isomerase QueA [Nitrospirae bacterium]|nr:tRNA preQ1(34) S-adenosylmethionine ribosyltransferase-isomerase QueA [Nitrospirota bacterium]